MKYITYRNIRIVTAVYVAALTSVAVSLNAFWLAAFGIATGMSVLWLARKRLHVQTTDEMMQQIAGKAAQMSYAIMAISLASVSLFLMFLPEQPYLRSLGTLMSYIALAMIALYTLFFYLYRQEQL
ncbi:DUF2178 domain-containing protein [Candidatus Woesebacteria bacterium]|nr:DUF2178 domain-containing protein [Candidatus Woesebacteria bacterium]MCD8507121.1 DUF2178 domain-containing protein [Candidatus Woesebacteria bacterium]MCD8526906.1 DUF2178 domain-containing protein [Candidatus Woesebacteria bacterium]MCD8546056.1 DUF2178 domain-containing protein [Candidatus Woesebacteria bacterium]